MQCLAIFFDVAYIQTWAKFHDGVLFAARKARVFFARDFCELFEPLAAHTQDRHSPYRHFVFEGVERCSIGGGIFKERIALCERTVVDAQVLKIQAVERRNKHVGKLASFLRRAAHKLDVIARKYRNGKFADKFRKLVLFDSVHKNLTRFGADFDKYFGFAKCFVVYFENRLSFFGTVANEICGLRCSERAQGTKHCKAFEKICFTLRVLSENPNGLRVERRFGELDISVVMKSCAFYFHALSFFLPAEEVNISFCLQENQIGGRVCNMEKGSEYLQKTQEMKDESFEAGLRPDGFASFTGQGKTLERLQVMVSAAKRRGDALSHILLHGPPGLGKTTLALILANEMESQIRITSGPVIEKASDLAGLLTNLEEGDILFIDEIHRISRTVEEYLYSAMEDYRIDIMIDQGPNARSVRLTIPRFTLIGATTRTGLLTAPLRSRFTLKTRLDYYSREELKKIVKRTCKILDVSIDDDGASEIARRSRGTPRIVNNLVRFVRDFSQERAKGKITKESAADALELLEIDGNGLDEMDKRIMRVMAQNYRGGPVGIGTIGVAVNEEADTLEEVHEPYLIQEGYIQRTPQGRVLTPKAWDAIGMSELGGNSQQALF